MFVSLVEVYLFQISLRGGDPNPRSCVLEVDAMVACNTPTGHSHCEDYVESQGSNLTKLQIGLTITSDDGFLFFKYLKDFFRRCPI
jgi:hypothetical protein